MSISLKELLRGHNISDVTTAQEHNLVDLQTKVNIVREAWGKPMTVTSGFRSRLDQERINPKATKSAHLEGKAVDIADPDGSLYKWLYDNEEKTKLLEKAELWVERGTKGWVHFQSRRASQRFFNP